ncbi:MAG: hypothetical protein HY735_17970 [Verrucomicrobia bacterium]|nr:hypothetical protein [Verrucomicrobiota bacterium]
MKEIPCEFSLDELRRELNHGDGVSQERLDELATKLSAFRNRLRPDDKDEPLPLFDRHGTSTGTNSPRWLCHVLGLRHRCAHILIVWRSPSLGDSLLLQIRDWSKRDSPGQLDISVGGHTTLDAVQGTEQTAFAEMLQELNLQPSDLDGGLQAIGGYGHDESCAEEHFFNSEWRDVFVGRLAAEAIGKVKFPDGEVAGICLIPVANAERLLAQVTLPMASALEHSLPRCLAIQR